MYLVQTPKIIQSLFAKYHWKIHTEEKVLYLTFDDGPIPQVTPQILDLLLHYKAKGTFFCVGENIEKYPEVFQRILKEGHALGSHTFNHLNGWCRGDEEYVKNAEKAAKIAKSHLFRPPYGRMRISQARILSQKYRIVMWDVLSGDFDVKNNPQDCFRNVIENAGPGSIVVFHDSLKSENNVLKALPLVLDYFQMLGYRFEALSEKKFAQSKEFLSKALGKK
jgi:peptidoglycan-N-acetylglucosamine deacetylase